MRGAAFASAAPMDPTLASLAASIDDLRETANRQFNSLQWCCGNAHAANARLDTLEKVTFALALLAAVALFAVAPWRRNRNKHRNKSIHEGASEKRAGGRSGDGGAVAHTAAVTPEKQYQGNGSQAVEDELTQ